MIDNNKGHNSITVKVSLFNIWIIGTLVKGWQYPVAPEIYF